MVQERVAGTPPGMMSPTEAKGPANLNDVLSQCHRTCAEIEVVLGTIVPPPEQDKAPAEMVPPTEPVTIAAKLDQDYEMARELARRLGGIAKHSALAQERLGNLV